MKIKALQVDRFGTWRNLHVTNLSPGLNVVYSPVAERDSSLVGFIHAVLSGTCQTGTFRTGTHELKKAADAGQLRLTLDSSCFHVALGDPSIEQRCIHQHNGQTTKTYDSESITSRLRHEIELLVADLEGGENDHVVIDPRDDRLSVVNKARRERIREVIRKIRQIDAVFQCAPDLQRLLEIDDQLAGCNTDVAAERTETSIETPRIDERIADCRVQIKTVRQQRKELRNKIRASSPPEDVAQQAGAQMEQRSSEPQPESDPETNEAEVSISNKQARVNEFRRLLHLDEILDRSRYNREMLENECRQQRDKQVLRPWQVAALGLTLVTGVVLLGVGLLSRPDTINVPPSLVGLVLVLAAALIKLSYTKSASQRLWSTNQQLNELATEIANIRQEQSSLHERLRVGDQDVAELLDQEVAELAALRARPHSEQATTAADGRKQRPERREFVDQYRRLRDMQQQLIQLARQLKTERSRYRKMKRRHDARSAQSQQPPQFESLKHERERIAKCIQSIRRQWGESEIQAFDDLADLTDSQLQAKRASALTELRRHRQRLSRAFQKRKRGRGGSKGQSALDWTQVTCRLASGHLASLTNLRLTRIFIKDDRLLVECERGRTRVLCQCPESDQRLATMCLRLARAEQHARRGSQVPIILGGLPKIDSASAIRSMLELLLEQCNRGRQIVLEISDIKILSTVRSCGVTVIELPDPRQLETRLPSEQRRARDKALDVLMHNRSALSLASSDHCADKAEETEQVYEVLGPAPLDESLDTLRRIAPQADPRGDSPAKETVPVRSNQVPQLANPRRVAEVPPQAQDEAIQPSTAGRPPSNDGRGKQTSPDLPNGESMPDWWPD